MSREDIEEVLRQEASRTPDAIVLRSDNPLDPSTPVDIPLKVVGWGVNGANITYKNVIGWDQINAEQDSDDEYFILMFAFPPAPGSDAKLEYTCHVMRVSHPHTKLLPQESLTDGGLLNQLEYLLD